MNHKTSETTKKRIHRSLTNQKGSVLIEFILSIPVLFAMIWGVLNIMNYMVSASHLNEAAYNAARSIAKELRGYEGTDIENTDIDWNRLEKELLLIVRQNQFLSYGLDKHEPVTAYDKDTCSKYFSEKEGMMKYKHPDIFCAYIEPYDAGGGKQHNKIVVKIRSSYQFIGGAVKNIEDLIMVNAVSTAPQELPDRLNYFTY